MLFKVFIFNIDIFFHSNKSILKTGTLFRNLYHRSMRFIDFCYFWATKLVTLYLIFDEKESLRKSHWVLKPDKDYDSSNRFLLFQITDSLKYSMQVCTGMNNNNMILRILFSEFHNYCWHTNCHMSISIYSSTILRKSSPNMARFTKK